MTKDYFTEVRLHAQFIGARAGITGKLFVEFWTIFFFVIITFLLDIKGGLVIEFTKAGLYIDV